MRTDPIVALISGPPPAAIAVVRLSGSGTWSIASQICCSSETTVVARRAEYEQLTTGDDAIVTYFEEGASFTGEESAEISIHGSRASIHALIHECIGLGCRQAEPGEFTLRAFMNGKLDLAQAEGVRMTVEAQTSTQLRQANRMRQGQSAETLTTIRKGLLSALAAIEADVDFSEEVGPLDRMRLSADLRSLGQQLRYMESAKDASRVIREGVTIALAGQPNAGKSSLLNRLLNRERAIVTDVPGTTRDTIEETLNLNGIPCRIVDTAGVRETDDAIEQQGVSRAWQCLAHADLILYLYDTRAGWNRNDDENLERIERPVIIVANKCDLSPMPARGIPISCRTGHGIPALQEAVWEQIPQLAEGMPYVLDRHAELLAASATSVERAADSIEMDVPADLASVDLQAAIRLLGEITGETASADVIDQIFRDFCIGK